MRISETHPIIHTVRTLAVLTGPLVLAASAQTAARAPAYTVERVPLPAGSKLAAGLNDEGDVVATVHTGELRAFQYAGGTLTELSYPAGLDIQDAGGVAVTGIDEAGRAVGVYKLSPLVRHGWHPVRWEDGIATELSLPASSSVTGWAGAATATSPAGLIVSSGWFIDFFTPGWVNENGWDDEPDFVPGNDPQRGFLWGLDGELRVLPTVPSSAGPEQTGTRVRDVNDAGQVIFWQEDPHLVQGFVFDPEHGVLRLPTGGAKTTAPFAINATGEVVGTLQFSDPGTGFRRDQPTRWRDGRAIELGMLPGHFTGRAVDLNDAGVAVGSVFTSNFTQQAAFVHAGKRMQDLQDLIPAGSAWDLDRPFAINSRGQIVGAGMLHGNQELFLLTPTELPHVTR
jgi:hypothetical protein